MSKANEQFERAREARQITHEDIKRSLPFPERISAAKVQEAIEDALRMTAWSESLTKKTREKKARAKTEQMYPEDRDTEESEP